MTITPVILSGGSGTRMWPLSRSGYPKQFLALHGEDTLLQKTVRRLDDVTGIAAPLVLTNDEQRFLVAEQLRQIGKTPACIVLEPVGRNTGPAIAAAAFVALADDPEAVLLVLPADHLIEHAVAFREMVERAVPHARAGKLVTFGIKPTEAHTGYGYIRCGAPQAEDSGAYEVVDFIEKPDLASAHALVADGGYYWNSGMFLFRADVYLREVERFAPSVLEQVRDAVGRACRDLDFLRLDHDAFAASPSDSIDYMVMEKTSDAIVVAADCLGWSDIGTWDALAAVSARDESGNTFKGDVVARDTKNTFVRSEHRMVAVLGVDDLVVVETADAVLVAHKSCTQDVKKIVEQLSVDGRVEGDTHRKVMRPWGSYEGIDYGERFQVKRIIVNPGASLSLQMHYHRAEHWIVVRGTARVVNGETTSLLSENQSTYIPLGTLHRLENPGKVPLEMIEVQSGSYLGEDDIVRFDDKYGRTESR
ncbi:mannose-1-phosphate guanylyltransferase [Burkholderia ubonensis]|uniref:mannose-1-phosphate guanylyltransferase n=1 Tax=Burkholderia ubonensis TaxID=101571 RepID=A0AB73FYV4_9BURK|nr:mannose-1-phosphate guanylyltransferase/mannose-6-phosphate isomerase [Burkholderia ubonensis]KVD26051.1 mannose-1-phosphate guanylyltransferase [Burkholderia ubonensis]KVK73987.1 mannose-1-phosphate guanylyltransferase [Burkholderia ubonensis]KVL69801.1 mannose-1-phosphate guanylyltransferase [Burkholderia ubonensis]KVM27100.1 mannose-1-phosphate guanylyltransferase [Burkholderia ubonensis]KVM42701.1 mannose-1-phosphate guanylyltransferase [Burkholderia ubonensis]